jgi:hypothetical protein
MRNIDDSDMKISIDRRPFLGITGAAAAALAGVLSTPAVAEPSAQAHVSGLRKLGSLEVSTVGLGVSAGRGPRTFERRSAAEILRAEFFFVSA